jgi:sialidase-1
MRYCSLAAPALAWLWLTTASFCWHAGTACGQVSTKVPAFEIQDLRWISWKPPLYHGWPTLARRADGELLLAFSGGREKHVCPFGRLEWMRSTDSGESWGWPQVLYDSPIDDRDAGLLVTPSGTILVTNFTSLAYKPLLKAAEEAKPGAPGAFADPKLLEEWQAAERRLSDEQKVAELGCYMLRSTDGGLTWSSRYRVPLNSPHGPIALKDGRLLYAGISLWEDRKVGVCESTDDGKTWKWLADIPHRPQDNPKDYHELHAVEASDGRLICHIRNHNQENYRELLQSISQDGGRHWTIPHAIDTWGLPSHLLRLRNGSLLMTYGHRRKPIGIQAKLSKDHGETWSLPMVLTNDGNSTDLGYPSTIETDDHQLVTVWYEGRKESPLAQLRQARWRLQGE